MPLEVILPKVDMDMASAKISKWHVRDGDTVAKGAVLFEIETDKAAMEIDSPGEGVIHHITAAEGAVVPVGDAVAFIYHPGETVGAAPKKVQAAAPVAVAGTPQPAPISSPGIVLPASGKPRATPLAKRLARSKGIAIEAVPASGPHGRIVAADIEKYVAATKAAPPLQAQAAKPAGLSSEAITSLYQPGSFTTLPLDGMRRTIAERLTLSKQTVPHFYLSLTCDVTQLGGIRERLNAQAPKDEAGSPRWKLSVNDFIIKAMALALQKVPNANVTWTDDGILQHAASDVGVAVAVEGGLFTPVIRTAETKSLSQISMEMKALAAQARTRKLAPSQYQGGTTAISNLGMFGIEQFTAIINPPHATILAVGAAMEQFVPVKGQPALRSRMVTTLSCDHRAVDGAVGAELLQAFRSYIEEPLLMLA